VALNIADLAEHAIDAVPDRVALICGDEQITYAEMEDKANRFAHYLIGRGDPGQRQLPLRRGRVALPVRELRHGRTGA
jgi:acyl-CoA synthetase (AMP-forming)/AMP-acid ligase II